jgi:stage V sporulation protein R
MYDGLPFEVVINSDPSRAYLMKSNTMGIQVLVMAHVIGHVAFFTMNKYFQNTRKDMVQVLDHAAKRFNEYEKVFGIDEIEAIIDAGHAIQFHSSPFDNEPEKIKKERVFEMLRRREHKVNLSQFRDILTEMDGLEERVKTDISLFNQQLMKRVSRQTPIEPSGDLLRYIIDYSHYLEDWQRDVLEIMRLEGRYYWPQIQTKYMNEGFATYWHEIMVERLYREGLINTDEHAQYNYSNSLVKAKHSKAMNPYLIGCRIWQDIVSRWDKGQYGREWENCEDEGIKAAWDTKEMKGREKMLQVMNSYTDWFFMQDFLTPELVDDLDMYIFVATETPVSVDLVRTRHTAREVRDIVVQSFSHNSIPAINVVNINGHDSGHLMLEHSHSGVDLQMKYAAETLKHVYKIWGKNVYLKTILNKEPVVLQCSMKTFPSTNPGAPGRQALDIDIHKIEDSKVAPIKK